MRGFVEKTEAGYGKVQRSLAHLRKGGRLPWEAIFDNMRWIRKPRTWDRLMRSSTRLAPTAARYGPTRLTTSRCGAKDALIEEPTKTTDTRSKSWTGDEPVELDAIDAPTLHSLADYEIWQHVDHDQLKVMSEAEQSEYRFLRRWADVLAEPGST